MYLYANRINFERVESIPTFRLVNLEPAEKPLLNKKGQFFVHVNEKTPYLRELVRNAQDLGLTVSGDGTDFVKGGDIRECPKGGLVSFGSSTRFDMNWIKRDAYFTENKYQPVLNIVEDWDKVQRALKAFAAEKRAKTYRESINTRYHANFCVVDGIVHSYEKNARCIQIPVKVKSCPFATQTLEIRILTY
jgi:hypothetical protein